PSENKTSTSSFPNHQSQFEIFWRRGWDSNPRNGFPLTAFPVLPIQPLLHLSPGAFQASNFEFGFRVHQSKAASRKALPPHSKQLLRNPKSLWRRGWDL